MELTGLTQNYVIKESSTHEAFLGCSISYLLTARGGVFNTWIYITRLRIGRILIPTLSLVTHCGCGHADIMSPHTGTGLMKSFAGVPSDDELWRSSGIHRTVVIYITLVLFHTS